MEIINIRFTWIPSSDSFIEKTVVEDLQEYFELVLENFGYIITFAVIIGIVRSVTHDIGRKLLSIYIFYILLVCCIGFPAEDENVIGIGHDAVF